MKIRLLLTLLGAAALTVSCIKDEPLNAEADIIECTVPGDIVKTDPKIADNTVMILIVPGSTDVTRMAPEFKLTPGAVIEPASGTVRDFTTPKLYKVTSQDGRWNKSYLVSVIETDLPSLFSFEDWKEIGKYEQPYEIIAGGVAQEIWSSGNAGYALTGGASVPSKFPTCSTPIAHGGRLAAKLETKSTGTFGSALNMPIAAGNLFIGTFDGMLATKNPMEATRFGLPFGKKPLRLKGYYSYVSAGNVTDKYNNLVIPEQRDSCQIYAVLYETDDNVECLFGDNVLTSPNIVAKAVVPDPVESPLGTYLPFDVEFTYLKQFDEEKMENYKYNLTVVFSSSRYGAYFKGAVGSTLLVDDVEVICEEKPAN